MSNIFIENYRFIIQIYCSNFSLRTVARKRERERERESVRAYEQRHKDPTDLRLTSTDDCFQQTPTSNWQLLKLTTFSKFANFYISKFRISLMWCNFTRLLRHLTHVPKFIPWFSFTQSNFWQDMNLCLHLVFLCRIDWSHILARVLSLELSNLTYTSTWRF